VHRLVSSLPQGGIAGRGWQEPEPQCRSTLLLDPVGARPSPPDVRFDGALHRVRRVQALAQDEGVLHRHAATLAHVRWAGVSSIADQHHTTGVPAVHLHRFDHVEPKLVVTLERGEVPSDRSTEASEALADAPQAAHEWIFERFRRVEPAEAVRSPAAHRHQTEEAAVAHHDRHGVHSTRASRYDAAPDDLPSVARRWPAQGQGANARVDAVGADDQLVVASGTVAELDRDATRVLGERANREPETGGHGVNTSHSVTRAVPPVRW
jgi:hypothetical protein